MVLITGATGILGRVLMVELLRRGKKVRATKRPSSDLDEVKSSLRFYTEDAEEYFRAIEWINVDFEDLDSIRAVLNGVEEIYHCAAQVSFHPKDKKQMYKTNIGGTKNWLYIAEEMKVKKFLFVSSIAVLDGENEEGMIDENSDFNPKYHHSSYAISKHFSEMEVWRASAEGMNVVVIQPGVIIGSGNWNKSSGTLFSTFAKMPFSFSGSTGYVDVRDVAKIAVELMKREIFGERFILISENKRYAEIGNFIRRKLGLKKAKPLSTFVLKMAQWVSFLFGWAVPSLRIVNKANVQALTTCTVISHQKIKDRLGYEFIPIEESLRFHLENYIKDQRKNLV